MKFLIPPDSTAAFPVMANINANAKNSEMPTPITIAAGCNNIQFSKSKN